MPGTDIQYGAMRCPGAILVFAGDLVSQVTCALSPYPIPRTSIAYGGIITCPSSLHHAWSHGAISLPYASSPRAIPYCLSRTGIAYRASGLRTRQARDVPY
eukprot:5457-Rhodomonas_salina.2